VILHRFSHQHARGPAAPLTAGRTRPAGRDRSRGAVIVEFAIVAPLLFMLVFGMLTGGLVMERRLALSGASREAARYGATLTADECNDTSRCGGRNWARQVQNVAASRGGRNVNESDVCVALVEGSGDAPIATSPNHTTAGGGACYADGSADSGHRVQVRITAEQEIQAVILTVPVASDVRSTARYER
jgi:Flp pilus assembly protein TadG